MQREKLDQLCVNTIRVLAVDAVEKARSGHPGLPMGAAPMAYVLWTRFLRHDPKDPDWPDRDRFVLSAGHGSMLLYALLHLTGYDLSLDDIRDFRQWGSLTPGHPEFKLTPGVECTTGPLGQGFGNAVGMAMAERFLAERFNRDGFSIVDHYTYALASDGDLMEGISHEAASMAGHLGLGRLICLYDDNKITIEGATGLTFSDDTAKRFAAYGWHVRYVDDGNDLDAIESAIAEAKGVKDKPSLIIVRTTIGYGSPNLANTSDCHGAPLGAEEAALTRKNLGWPEDETFLVPPEVAEQCSAVDAGREAHAAWSALFDEYAAKHPADADQFKRWMAGELPKDWDADLPGFDPADGEVATRSASGKVFAAIAARVTNLIGGSADLGTSVKTVLPGATNFSREDYGGRNVRFGVREHAMGAIVNGMAYHGGLIPFGSTFFIFSDYMRPSIRLAAMNRLRGLFVFSHDSIGVGEDGPTHQPIEHLASYRAMPGLVVIRPADAGEVVEAWRYAMSNAAGPTVLVLTRQKVPVIERSETESAAGVVRGGYVVKREKGQRPDVILLSSGSEVHVAIAARGILMDKGVDARVVSLPSFGLFDAQNDEYRNEILPPSVTARVAVEAASSFGWDRYAGPAGRIVALDRYGASAPFAVLREKLGITPARVAEEALAVVGSK